MNWRKRGFTQRKPAEPGIYFVQAVLRGLDAPRRIREGWDVASVYYHTGGHDANEGGCHWRIATLDGIDHAWRPGMWIKGPISPEGTP